MQAFLRRSSEHYFVSELISEERGCSMCAAGGLAQWLSYSFLPSLVEAEDPLLGHGIYKGSGFLTPRHLLSTVSMVGKAPPPEGLSCLSLAPSAPGKTDKVSVLPLCGEQKGAGSILSTGAKLMAPASSIDMKTLTGEKKCPLIPLQ